MNAEIKNLGTSEKSRFWELDFARGICVILMIFDHLMFSMAAVMPQVDIMLGKTVWESASMWIADNYWQSALRASVRLPVLLCFFLICGICCTFSRSNVRRGAQCFAVGCVITFVTVVADRAFDLDMSIYFGVLHMLGVSMIVYGLLQKLGMCIAKAGKSDKSRKVTAIVGDYLAPAVGLILVIVFFACFCNGIEQGAFTTDVFIEDKSMSVIASLFLNVLPKKNGVESVVLGGADYWPLLPWLGFVLLGGAIGIALYHGKAKNYLARLDGKWNRPICFVGRHALVIYVAHQAAIFVLLSLLTLIL